MNINPKITKAFNHFKGIIHAIGSDGVVTRNEYNDLKLWCKAHEGICTDPPFNLFYEEVKTIIDTGIMTSEELQDMIGIMQRFETKFQIGDESNSHLHYLQGLCYGILADDQINKYELELLQKWLENNGHYLEKPQFKSLYGMLLQMSDIDTLNPEQHKIMRISLTEIVNMED